jgi:hypothetical protein
MKLKKKTVGKRVYHNNDDCPQGKEIPKNERESGNGGYRLCLRSKSKNR